MICFEWPQWCPAFGTQQNLTEAGAGIGAQTCNRNCSALYQMLSTGYISCQLAASLDYSVCNRWDGTFSMIVSADCHSYLSRSLQTPPQSCQRLDGNSTWLPALVNPWSHTRQTCIHTASWKAKVRFQSWFVEPRRNGADPASPCMRSPSQRILYCMLQGFDSFMLLAGSLPNNLYVGTEWWCTYYPSPALTHCLTDLIETLTG